MPREETPPAQTRDSQAIQLEFLLTDLDAGLTFARLAQTAGDDSDKRARNLHNAETAYATVARLLPQVVLAEEQRLEVTTRLEELRQAIDAQQ